MSKNSMDLHIRLSEEEYQIIEKNAKAADKTISAYVRYVSCNMCMLQFDYSCVEEHTHQLSVIKNAIIQLTFTIIKSRKCVPADLEYIHDKLNEVFKTENEFLESYSKIKKNEQKLLSKTVKKIVKETLEKN